MMLFNMTMYRQTDLPGRVQEKPGMGVGLMVQHPRIGPPLDVLPDLRRYGNESTMQL